MLTKEDAPPGQIRFLSPLGTTTARVLAQELSTSSSKSSGLIKLLAYDLLEMISAFFRF